MRETGEMLGCAVAISSKLAVVGGPGNGEDTTCSDWSRSDVTLGGTAYVFLRTKDNWKPLQSESLIDLPAGSRGGAAVATDGSYVVVGAPRSDHWGKDAGAVYVFSCSESGCIADKGAPLGTELLKGGGGFGGSVAVSGDYILVGAPWGGANGDGAAYVFGRDELGWVLEKELLKYGVETGDLFGSSVAISESWIAVGATGESSASNTVNEGQDNNDATASGAVYTYRLTGGEWKFDDYIKATNSDAGDHFGTATSISGNTLAVGAPDEDGAAILAKDATSPVPSTELSNNESTNRGAAYYFDLPE